MKNISNYPESVRLIPLGNQKVWEGIKPLLEVHPNPADNTAWFVVRVPEGVEEARIELSDMHGKTVWQSEVAHNGILEVDLRRMKSGFYIYTLYLDNINVESEKLSVVK